MDLFSDDKLFRFLLFFMPGFLSLKIYDWLIPNQPRKFSDALFEVVGYSFFNYAILCWWWLPVTLHTEPDQIFEWSFVLQVVIVTVVLPILWPILYVLMSSKGILTRWFGDPKPTAWDKVFGMGDSFYVTIHLKDGRRIGGVFERASFASSYPHEETLYLEEEWLLNESGGFTQKVDGTKGILVLANQIAMVEFFQKRTLPEASIVTQAPPARIETSEE